MLGGDGMDAWEKARVLVRQGKLGFALPSHGPMETTERENHDGMGVRALVIPRASHRSDVFARAVLLMVPVLIEPQW